MYTLLIACNGFLRFTSGLTPTDLLTASMAAEPFWFHVLVHMDCTCWRMVHGDCYVTIILFLHRTPAYPSPGTVCVNDHSGPRLNKYDHVQPLVGLEPKIECVAQSVQADVLMNEPCWLGLKNGFYLLVAMIFTPVPPVKLLIWAFKLLPQRQILMRIHRNWIVNISETTASSSVIALSTRSVTKIEGYNRTPRLLRDWHYYLVSSWVHEPHCR